MSKDNVDFDHDSPTLTREVSEEPTESKDQNQ